MKKPLLATAAFALVTGLAVAAVYLTRSPSAEQVDVELHPAVDSVLATTLGGVVRIEGSARHAEGCTVRVGDAQATISGGAFVLEFPAPETIGPAVVWIETWCGDTRIATVARRVEVALSHADAEGSGSAGLFASANTQTVARVRFQTAAVTGQAEQLALSIANERLQTYVQDEVRGAEVIRLDVPLGRWAEAAEGWANRRLDDDATRRFGALIPDGLSDTTLLAEWGEHTRIVLSNLRLNVTEGAVRATFDVSVAIDVRVSADPPQRRDAGGWNPDPLRVELVRIGATFELSDWPNVRVRDVDLLGDLCERAEGRFWRRTCSRIAPQLAELVERPVERTLNERAQAWAAGFDIDRALFEAFARLGGPADSVDALQTAADAAGLQLHMERIDANEITVSASVSDEWLGGPSQLSSPATPPASPVELSVALPLLNRGLQSLFDRPFTELASEVSARIGTVDPERAALLETALDDLAGRGRLAVDAWRDALAMANLRVEPEFALNPLLAIGDDGALLLTLYDARVFSGAQVNDVAISVSFALPVRFEADDLVFRIVPDMVGMADRFALEAIGPDTTTRDDARRFGVFFARELRRSLGVEEGPVLVDLSGLADLGHSLPTIPRAGRAGPIGLTLDRMSADAAIGGFVVSGSAVVHPSVTQAAEPR